MGQDSQDTFGLGMVEFTLKKKQGDFHIFRQLLEEKGNTRHCLFQ